MNTPQTPLPLIKSGYDPINSIIYYDDLDLDDLISEDEEIYDDEICEDDFIPTIVCPGFGEMEEN